MSRPRHFGSSPSLNRSLSRLAPSSSFQARQSNSRIYTFLIAGGLFLFATVVLLQVHLLRAPQGSNLSPLENGKSDEGVGAEQTWWKENAGKGRLNRGLDDPATGKAKGVVKGNKLGRKMGAAQSDGDRDDGDEDMEAGDEMGDDGETDEDEDAEQDLFDIDVDDRLVDEETEDLDDVDLRILAEMSNEDDSTTENTVSRRKPAQPAVPTNQGVDRLAKNEKGKEKPVRHESKQNAIPDWVLDRNVGIQQRGIAGALGRGFEGDLVKDLENRKGSFFWDHALGMRKRSALENVEPLRGEDLAARGNVDMKRLAAGDEDAATVAFVQLRGFKEVVQNWRERFNSDDELVDENVEERLERVREIEDALLLNGDGQAPDKAAPSKKLVGGGYLKKGRGFMNPANNPMLQDPDTDAGTWMTKTDKEMLRALRGGQQQQPKALLRGSILNDGTVTNPVVSRENPSRSDGKQDEKEEGNAKAAEIVSDQKGAAKANSVGEEASSLSSKEGEKQWGQYPGLGSSLSFSAFMEAFLGQESCAMSVFMVWTTPAWGFTARHQRVLESLFRLHRFACVAVFSDTFELGVFHNFVKEGYKVAVVRPNLQELLAETPSDVFTAVLPKWKEKPLFPLHYSELLRLAALYKFGGVYLDMDMLVLRPLDSLHNTVGSEITPSADLRLNGAFLAFEKSSLFLKKCMEEFTRTYDETLDQYNGADLLTRVANSTVDDKGSTWTQFPGLLKIQGPFTFFPLDSSGISKFFAAPKDDIQKQQQGQLLTRISEEAYTVHLWSSLTSNLVPEINSLVGILLSRSCLQCKDVL